MTTDTLGDRASGLQPRPSLLRGGRYWLASYAAMLRFNVLDQRTWLSMLLLMQVLFGTGMAIIYGFYIGSMPSEAALYLVTGAPAIAAITTGMVFVPQMVGDRKATGTWDFIWSLPPPRSATVASTFTVYTVLSIPGIVVTLLLASWRYGLHLTPTPMVIPAFLLSSLMATSVGFGLAQAIRNPVVTNLIVNIFIFVVLLFSPVVFPISQLPGWLAALHRWLPVYHVAQVLRASVTTGLVSNVATSYAVLVAWTVAGWAATAWVVGRRP
ncbi:MAG: ABC transporter permease [Candidatus Limnocylindrales bacterium]